MDAVPKKIERKLAAILAADVVGYSRLMGADEEDTFARLKAHRRELIDPEVAAHHGRIIKLNGDGALIEFPSVVEAVRCAVRIQAAIADRNEKIAPEKRIVIRIGINLGDVIVEDGDIYGDGVNVAARLEAIAEPGGICISARVHDEIQGKVDLAFDDLGERQLKNIALPVRAFQIRNREAAISSDITTGARALALPDRPSIAVLPFTNIGGDPEQEYFADGITEDIITALSRLKWLFVIARNSTFTFKGRAVDVREISRVLGVRYVLLGSIRKSGQRLRIGGQLIDATTGQNLWADKFDGGVEDVFDLQDRVTGSVVGAIEPSIEAAEIKRIRSKPTENLNAYHLYLLGLSRLHTGTPGDLALSQGFMLRAVDADPHFALAKACVARCIMARIAQGVVAAEDIQIGAKLAEEAIRDARDDAAALGIAGHSIAHLTRNYDVALFAVQRAVSLNPNSAIVLYNSASVHSNIGQDLVAIDQLHRAIRLSPIDPSMPLFLSQLAWASIASGARADGLSYGQKAIAIWPERSLTYRPTIVALVVLGRIVEACELARKHMELSPNFRLSRYPFPRRHDTAREELINALRIAGIPE